ncbi:MAG TPA: N-formylglutamate amidohydrolase [Rhizomicrobium sp.]|jgi:N-formylglutamate deformylase|nr:N-formylglutamate amidohydrolase [Rhizomicrobium sp.]
MAEASDPGNNDAALTALYSTPFVIRRPQHHHVPFVFASPHSGRLYPESFVAASRLSALSLRRSEDAFVEELFAPVLDLGAPLIAANFPRAYVDANRNPAELDPAMFDGELGVVVDAVSPRVSAGLGVIPRIVRDGAEIYRGKLPVADAKARMNRLYKPYHEALAHLVEETRERFGVCVVVDCHSMPSAAAAPEVVLGDRYGMSAAAILTKTAENAFERFRFTVSRNAPYAGGYTTHLYARRSQGIHALQIEVSRSLYLDEERIVKTAAFARVQARLVAVLSALVSIDPAMLMPPRATAWAAE